MPKKLTTAAFIEKAKAIHGDQYEYSKTNYVDAHALVTITCKVHGDFQQRACNHTNAKAGCFECHGNDKKTTSQAIAEAIKVHGDVYDYTETKYTGAKDPITVICRVHGPFTTTYNRHVTSKNGCSKCAPDTRRSTMQQLYGASNAMDIEQFRTKRDVTNLQKYGTAYPSQSPQVRQATEATLLKKYGTVNIRDVQAIDEKIKQTNVKLYGATHPWKNPEIREDIAQTMKQKHGRTNYMQVTVSDYALDKLSDKDWLYDQHVNGRLTQVEIAQQLGVDPTTVSNRFKDHGIVVQRFNQSVGEKQICQLLERHGVVYRTNDRTVIGPKEIDIYIPEHNLAIEYCGLYWHREDIRPRMYHVEKMRQCEEQGIRLFTIYEDEWVNRRIQVERKLLHTLNISEQPSVYARACIVQSVPTPVAVQFLDDNHIQGSGPGSIKYGLYHDSELVALATFIQTGTTFTLSRYATAKRVPGGLSKLLSHFKKHHEWTRIESFADLRWSDGNMYQTTGWTLEYTIPPDYYWCKGNSRYHKFAFRRAALPKKLDTFDPTLSEAENCRNNGYWKIYDCGKQKFVMTQTLNTDVDSTDVLSDDEISSAVEALDTGTAVIWSCDPSAVPPWTEEAKAQLTVVLENIFSVETDNETQGQDRCDYEGTIPNPSGNGDVV